MTRDLDISLLRAFAVVADRRSMRAASHNLNLTQGAISQRVARLEALTGGALLVRDRRGVRPTSAGERLLGKIRPLLALNDEIWADLIDGTLHGPVSFGVPFDLVGTHLTPVLKRYGEAWPEVSLTLICGTSPDLTRALAGGQLDLALLEEPASAPTGECLAVDRLSWVGAKGGRAHAKNPLPVSLVAGSCAFRPAVLAALQHGGREWRTVFESGSLDASFATVRADLAVSAWLTSTVPADLDILRPETGLPELPSFAITLHRPDRPLSAATAELARHVREGFPRPRQAA